MKNSILIAPWANYSDVSGGNKFVNSVSEPVTEFEANRMVACMGCRSIKFASETEAEIQSLRGQETLTAEAHQTLMLEAALQVDMSELPVDTEFQAVEPGDHVTTDEVAKLGQNGGNPVVTPVSGDSTAVATSEGPSEAPRQDGQEGPSAADPVRPDPAPTTTGLPATKASSKKKN